MSRPAPQDNPIDSTTTDWVSRLNENFSAIIDEPFPMALYADVSALGTAADPKLYKDCLALVGASGSAYLYISDGTSWSEYRAQLTYIADLDTGTATLDDIKTAYNDLLADMQTKEWMV
jgi:hypothetical protein